MDSNSDTARVTTGFSSPSSSYVVSSMNSSSDGYYKSAGSAGVTLYSSAVLIMATISGREIM